MKGKLKIILPVLLLVLVGGGGGLQVPARGRRIGQEGRASEGGRRAVSPWRPSSSSTSTAATTARSTRRARC